MVLHVDRKLLFADFPFKKMLAFLPVFGDVRRVNIDGAGPETFLIL